MLKIKCHSNERFFTFRSFQVDSKAKKKPLGEKIILASNKKTVQTKDHSHTNILSKTKIRTCDSQPVSHLPISRHNVIQKKTETKYTKSSEEMTKFLSKHIRRSLSVNENLPLKNTNYSTLIMSKSCTEIKEKQYDSEPGDLRKIPAISSETFTKDLDNDFDSLQRSFNLVNGNGNHVNVDHDDGDDDDDDDDDTLEEKSPIELDPIEEGRHSSQSVTKSYNNRIASPTPSNVMSASNSLSWTRERSLEQQIESLQEKLKDTEERLQSLRIQYDTVSQMHRALRDTNHQIQEEMDRLKIDAQRVNECAKALRTELQSARKDRADALELQKTLQREVDQSRMEKEKAVEKAESNSRQILDLQRQCKEMERIMMRKNPDSVSGLISKRDLLYRHLNLLWNMKHFYFIFFFF